MVRPSRIKAAMSVMALAVACLIAASGEVRAEMTIKNLQVAARSLGFLTGRDIAGLRVAIIYASDIEASKKEAEALVALLGSTFNAGRVTLIPVSPSTVPTTKLSSLDHEDVAFVTDNLKPWYGAIAEEARARHIVTVTSDLDCVINGACVLGVQAEPRVQVLINRAAAVQSAIEFAPGFRMLVTEL